MSRRSGPRCSLRAWVAWAVFLVMLFAYRRAEAYAWMIRHEYGGCNQCHADPSGGGLLTPYGRAQGDLLLRTRYDAQTEEPGKSAGFLFGAFDAPGSLLLGGDLRTLALLSLPQQGTSSLRAIPMQYDVQAQWTVDRVRANASVGYAHEGARPAAITNNETDNLVSRVHWLGVDLGSDREWLLRAGRMNLPFGIRFVEHTLAVRQATRTNINDQQQHGLSLAYNGDRLRGEVMAVLGNYQIRPDMYRSRGGVGYLEVSAANRLAIGASAMILHTERDVLLSTPAWRHAYAVSVRYSPVPGVVVLGEADLLFQSQPEGINETGHASVLQLDWEPVQGLHLATTAETENARPSRASTTYSWWGTVDWFFAPHLDVRLDVIEQSLGLASGRLGMTTILGQIHMFL